MEKIINVKVSGSEIEQSTNFGGIQGEGGARHLKILFDEEWSGYSKSVTFLDANLENPVKILLTTKNLEVDGTYLIAIPFTPLLTGGKFTYIIEGYADGILQRSVSKELKVRYAPSVDAEDLEGVITPTEADQLNLSIQNEAERIDALSIRAEALEGEMTSLSENLDAKLLSKADTSYVEDGLMLKADKSYVDAELSAKADTKDVEEALSAKANTEDVEDALTAKANTSYVAEEFLKKADKKSVAEELSEKADTSYVEDALDKKADKTEVETALSGIDARLENQEEYVKEKTNELFDHTKLFAGAIKGKASGEVVQFDDASPIEHNTSVKVSSKNLLDVDEVLSFTQMHSIDVNLKAGTYTISLSEETHEGEDLPCIRFYTNDVWMVLNPVYNGQKVVLPQDESKVYIYSNGYGESASTGISATVKQLMVSVDGGEYTPYVDPSTVTLTRCGKNLLINKKGDANIAGIEWVVNEDGTLNALGTTTHSDYYFFGGTTENEDSFVAPCDLVLSTSYEHDYLNNVFGARTSSGLLGTHITRENHVIIPEGTRVDGVFLRVSGRTISQQNIECQMEIGTTKTEYEAYKGQNFTPNADGTVEGVTSILPTMTLMTDNNGAIIEAEYNKDTNKVIEELTNAIISLGGNI